MHWGRNSNNDEASYDAIDKDKTWTQLPNSKAIFHQMGKGNEKNEKYVNRDGREMVYRPSSDGKASLVTSSKNMGTYNYVNPTGSIWNTIGHAILDVFHICYLVILRVI